MAKKLPMKKRKKKKMKKKTLQKMTNKPKMKLKPKKSAIYNVHGKCSNWPNWFTQKISIAIFHLKINASPNV